MTQQQPAAVRDVRHVPLQQLADATPDGALKRILPAADAERVPVAAFNASL